MHSRRSVVAGCGAVLASATLSGCGFLDSSGGSGRSEYTDWAYEADVDVASFTYLQYGELASTDGLPEDLLSDELLGIPVEEFDHHVTFDSQTVYEGSFDADELRAGLESDLGTTLQEEGGERAGYQLYSVGERPVRVGLQDGSGVIGAGQKFDAILDAGAGEGDRLVDSNDDFDELTSELGVRHSVNGRVNLSSDAASFTTDEAVVATGNNTDFGAEITEFEEVVLYETAEDAESADDENAIRSDYEEFDGISDVSSNVDGRVVTITYTQETDGFA